MKHSDIKNKWFNSNNELKSVADLALDTITSIPKNKHNFFFAKNNKEISYLGSEGSAIFIERVIK